MTTTTATTTTTARARARDARPRARASGRRARRASGREPARASRGESDARDAPARASTSRRVACASLLLATRGGRARAATDASRAALEEARAARDDVARARAALGDVDASASAASTSERLPLKEISAALNTSAVKNLERNAAALDAVAKARPLEDWEREAWRGVRDDEWLTQSQTTTLPVVKRPNDFLCFVFSCYNDPRAPASTEVLLTLRLAKDGVAMGRRGDKRITDLGLAASLDDVLEKLDAYLAFASKFVEAGDEDRRGPTARGVGVGDG